MSGQCFVVEICNKIYCVSCINWFFEDERGFILEEWKFFFKFTTFASQTDFNSLHNLQSAVLFFCYFSGHLVPIVQRMCDTTSYPWLGMIMFDSIYKTVLLSNQSRSEIDYMKCPFSIKRIQRNLPRDLR